MKKLLLAIGVLLAFCIRTTGSGHGLQAANSQTRLRERQGSTRNLLRENGIQETLVRDGEAWNSWVQTQAAVVAPFANEGDASRLVDNLRLAARRTEDQLIEIAFDRVGLTLLPEMVSVLGERRDVILKGLSVSGELARVDLAHIDAIEEGQLLSELLQEDYDVFDDSLGDSADELLFDILNGGSTSVEDAFTSGELWCRNSSDPLRSSFEDAWYSLTSGVRKLGHSLVGDDGSFRGDANAKHGYDGSGTNSKA